MISPIGGAASPERESADRFLNNIVRRALTEDKYIVRRADEEVSPYAITEAMLRRLLDADLCVADISGLNANVMYELALAHAAGKKVVTMTRDEGRPPFDIKDMRLITYGFMWEEVEKAVESLRLMAEHEPADARFREMFNPVTTAFKDLMDRQKAESDRGSSTEAVARMLENFERKLDHMMRAVPDDSSQFGMPTVTQTNTGPVALAMMTEKNLDRMAQEVLQDPTLGPKSRTQFQAHVVDGRILLEDAVNGRINLPELEKWNADTDALLRRREQKKL